MISFGLQKIRQITSRDPFKLSSTKLKNFSVLLKMQVWRLNLWIFWINSLILDDLLLLKFKIVIVLLVWRPRDISESPVALNKI